MNIARQGFYDAQTERKREQAYWMSLHLSAATGEQVSIAQLMGEEAVDVASRTAEAEDAAAALEKKMKKAGLLHAKK